MTEIKPHYRMPLEQAVNSRMDDAAWKQYLSFHEVSITRRDE